jgi:hypothetical protein
MKVINNILLIYLAVIGFYPIDAMRKWNKNRFFTGKFFHTYKLAPITNKDTPLYNKNINALSCIKTNLDDKIIDHESPIHKITGFYGLIGPNINKTNVNNLYELFTGNGQIQGLFFNKGKVTFIKKSIQTKKLIFETMIGKTIQQNVFVIAFFFWLNKIPGFPNLLGTANTALINVNNSIYSLFERDLPYKINIDWENKTINTEKYVKIPKIQTFSAHSKFFGNKIHTIDYDILLRKANYYILNEKFTILKKAEIPVTYLPIIHDFIVLSNLVLIMDSPFFLNYSKIFSNNIPVDFDGTKYTKIHSYNLETNQIQTFIIPYGIFIFHYAQIDENEDLIYIYAPIYDKISFSDLHINGKYRKIILNKRTGEVKIEKNPYLEEKNLDFPIIFGEKRILMEFCVDSKNNNKGFQKIIILDKLIIDKEICLAKNHWCCGEPAIIYIDHIPFLLLLTYDKEENGFICLINLITEEQFEISIGEKVNIGFHSLFL